MEPFCSKCDMWIPEHFPSSVKQEEAVSRVDFDVDFIFDIKDEYKSFHLDLYSFSSIKILLSELKSLVLWAIRFSRSSARTQYFVDESTWHTYTVDHYHQLTEDSQK